MRRFPLPFQPKSPTCTRRERQKKFVCFRSALSKPWTQACTEKRTGNRQVPAACYRIVFYISTESLPPRVESSSPNPDSPRGTLQFLPFAFWLIPTHTLRLISVKHVSHQFGLWTPAIWQEPVTCRAVICSKGTPFQGNNQ